jgi:hypothetical protein
MHRDHLFNFRTDTHVDALLIPAMITLALYPLMSNETARRAIRVWDFPMFVVMELFLLTTRVPCFFTLQAIVLPLLILSTVLHPNTVQGSILESKPAPLDWVDFIQSVSMAAAFLWRQFRR